MIIKLLIDFYRWLWGMPPFAIKTVNDQTLHMIVYGALLDISVIIGIIGLAITIYRKRGER